MTQACGPSSSQSCNFTCPKGGNWYTCRNFPYFTGCCESDPCHNTTAQAACPDLYPASFNPNVYNSILPNDCLNAGSNNWYTCNDTNPTFIGCCRSNPCVQGSCPTTDLIPAAWSTSNPNQLQIFLDAPTTLQPGATPSSTASESGMAMPMPSESENRENSGLSTGAIAGIAIGVIIVILTIVFLFAILMYHRGWHARRKREREIGHHPIPCMTKKEISPQHPVLSSRAPSRNPSIICVPSSSLPSSTLPPYMPMCVPEENKIMHESWFGDQYRASPHRLPYEMHATNPQPHELGV